MITPKHIVDAFHFRHACKVFDATKKISDENFETILETARLSPSSFGFEPWKFLVIQNQNLRDKLKPLTWGAQNTLNTASHYVIILARKTPSLRYDSEYITHMMKDIHHLPNESAEARRGFYKTFQAKDFNLLESDRAMFDWAGKQCYIALGNMMNTAAMLGIDSCPIEGFKAKELELLMQEAFEVDTKEFGVAVMVAFGYRVDAPREKTRQSMDVISRYFN